jgi:hypothetical protein
MRIKEIMEQASADCIIVAADTGRRPGLQQTLGVLIKVLNS